MFRIQLPLILLPCFFCSTLTSGPSLVAQEIKPVAVASVLEAEVRSGQTVVGTVKPLRTSRIGSALDGRVLEFLVDEGE
ncbi:MAG: hypothetical protein P8J27_06020, partial [Mariniblastus sp.]|nr:hypothetical protein [Mariniblastus sp.]